MTHHQQRPFSQLAVRVRVGLGHHRRRHSLPLHYADVLFSATSTQLRGVTKIKNASIQQQQLLTMC